MFILLLLLPQLLLPPFYSHYIGQPALELEDFVKSSFTARMPSLTAISTFRLGRRH